MKHLCFHMLLYIDFDDKALSVNGMKGDFERQISICIRCCEAVAKSLAFFTSKDLVVLTNHKDYIERISPTLKVVEISFRLKIPRDIEYYSAHYIGRYLAVKRFISWLRHKVKKTLGLIMGQR